MTLPTRRPLLRDRLALQKLPRAEIQAVARKEKIKANGKTADIIDRLLDKYPDGVPSYVTPLPLRIGAAASKRRRILVTVKTEDELSDGQETSNAVQVEGSIVELPVAGPSGRKVTMARVAEYIDHIDHHERHKKVGPSNKDMRVVRRELTRLVNMAADLSESINELDHLLAYARTVADEVTVDVKELVWVRFCLEEDVMKRFKRDRTLWDGTKVMPVAEDREKWEGFLQEIKAEQEEQMRRELEELEKQEEELRKQQELFDDSSSEASDAGDIQSLST